MRHSSSICTWCWRYGAEVQDRHRQGPGLSPGQDEGDGEHLVTAKLEEESGMQGALGLWECHGRI